MIIVTEHTIVMYDEDVYHFGAAKATEYYVASAEEVLELNVLQVVSASENVYLYSPAASIYKVADRAMKHRRSKKTMVRVVAERKEENGSSEIIQTSRQDIRVEVGLQFLRTHKLAARWLKAFRKEKYQRVEVVRNEQLLERFQTHDQAVRDGKPQPSS